MKSKEMIIDGKTANLKENMRYRGAGMVSANNSSRLLLDYRTENPKAYWEIMEHIFGKNEIGVNHLKIELGSDVNSSSGTEPAVMRSADEKADVTRGAGFRLAADAKKINPDLTLDMLWWSEPRWVSDSADIYAARYKWHKETLDAAYEIYGLKFDYVSSVQNERASDPKWVKYLRKKLNEEKDCPYDYSKIKIVGGEEVCTWCFADGMLCDKELMDVTDVMGSHYTSSSTQAAQSLAYEHGKELWLSEASSPMGYPQGARRFDGSGLSGLNGVLDIANRIIGMYPNGKMTLYEYQPVVSAYYDGACYCQKQLITACDPWSGYYSLDSGFFMSLHFSRFIKKGWAFIDSACFSDGKAGGDGHCIVDAVYNHLTAADPETGDYSTVISNSTDETITYNFTVSSLAKAPSDVIVWETRGGGKGKFGENYFKKIAVITPVEDGGKYRYKLSVKPFSLVTVSTLSAEENEYENTNISERKILPLPYFDDFNYKNYPIDYLPSRGYAPRYTTDEGGAFEVMTDKSGNSLVQRITHDLVPKEWGWTPNPVTTLGDDRWYNYSVAVNVSFEQSENKSENYAGAGLRYILACNGYSGFWLQLFESGEWKLKFNDSDIASGNVSEFDGTVSHNLKIEAEKNIIRAYIDEKIVTQHSGMNFAGKGAAAGAGRAALYSSYNKNRFNDLEIMPIGGEPYVVRYDDTDSCFEYEGDWQHDTMSGFKNYMRTISAGKSGTALSASFDGTGIVILGETDEADVSVSVDGGKPFSAHIFKTASRGASLLVDGLNRGKHIVKITVLNGEYCVDGMEVMGGK